MIGKTNAIKQGGGGEPVLIKTFTLAEASRNWQITLTSEEIADYSYFIIKGQFNLSAGDWVYYSASPDTASGQNWYSIANGNKFSTFDFENTFYTPVIAPKNSNGVFVMPVIQSANTKYLANNSFYFVCYTSGTTFLTTSYLEIYGVE